MIDPSQIIAGYSNWLIYLSLIWILPWKGVALWKAVKNNQKKWFIALFLLNTFALLEIIYIFYFSKSKSKPKDEEKQS